MIKKEMVNKMPENKEITQDEMLKLLEIQMEEVKEKLVEEIKSGKKKIVRTEDSLLIMEVNHD